MRTMIFVLVVVGVFSISCTRKASESSKLQISLPAEIVSQKVGALSGNSKLGHVAINVTGPGITSPIVFSWDGHEGGTLREAPSSFAFEVSRGENRLVQVLGVYMDSENDSMTFAYGDSINAFNSSEVVVTVPLNVLGAANSIMDGNISGRILNGPNSGPTGVIDVFFKPPGKQGLIIERGFAVAGWFSVFSLSGVDLEYKINGTNLFGDGFSNVNIDSPIFFPSANGQVVRAAIPVHVRVEQGNQTSMNKIEQATTYVWGFWSQSGFDLSDSLVCNGLGSSPLTRVLNYANPPSASVTPLTFSQVNSSASYPSAAALLNSDSPLSYVTIGGGTSSCTALTQNRIPISSYHIDGNGKDNSAGFRNLFVNSSIYSVFSTEPKGNGALIKGKVLPGVSGVFSGIRFFKRISASGESEFRMENPKCLDISNGMAGFSFAGETNVIQADNSFSADVDVNTTSPEFMSRRVAVVACGFNSAGMAPVGLFTYLEGGGGMNNPGNGNGGMPPASKVVVYSPASSSSTGLFFNHVCSHITVEAQDNGGNPGSVPSGTQVSFSTLSGFQIYTNKYCSQQESPIMLNNFGKKDLWVKYTLSGSGGPFPLTYTVNNGLTGGTLQVSYQDSPTVVPKMVIKTANTIYAHSCQQVIFESWHDDGTVKAIASWTSAQSYTFPSVSGLSFYTDPNCTNSASSGFTLSASTSSDVYFYRYSGGLSTLDLQPAIVASIPQEGGNAIVVNQPGVASSVRLEMSNNIASEQCQPATLSLVDSSGRTAMATANSTFSFTFNGGAAIDYSGFYSDPSCSTSYSSPAINTGQTNAGPMYFRWAGAPGVVNISPVITLGPALNTMPMNVNVGPVMVASLPVYPSGVSYSHPNTFNGYAPLVFEGASFGLTIEARSPLGNLVVSFSDTNLSPSALNFGTSYPGVSCSAPIWTVGVGTMTCSYTEPSSGFALAAMGFRAGGAPGPYPSTYSEWTTGRILILPKAEDNVHGHKLGSAPFPVYSNRCQPILYARGPNALPYLGAIATGSAISVVLNKTDGGITGYYSDSTCTSPISNATLSVGESAKVFYIKLNGSTLSQYVNTSFDAIFNFGHTNSVTTFGGSTADGAFNEYRITMNGSDAYNVSGVKLRYGGCSPAMVVSTDANGSAIAVGGSGNITLTASNNFATFYSNPTCTSQISFVPYSAGDKAHVFYIRPNVQVTSGESISVSNGSEAGSVSNISVITTPN